jgi:hypothetical protein
MREGIHFMDDDPMLYPQIFVREVGFLSVIARPTNQGTLSTAFYKPTEQDFELQHPNRHWSAIGKLSPILWAKSKLMVDELHNKFRRSILTSAPDDLDVLVRNTARLMEYDVVLQRLLQRLTFPSSRKTCFTVFSILQRTYLEFHACYNWVTKYQRRCSQRNIKHDILDVVGAFTDDWDVADALFYAGIPVWMLHSVIELAALRIDAVTEPLPLTPAKLPIGRDLFLDVVETNPPSRTIYTGEANNLARYQAIAYHIKALILTGVISPEVSSGPERFNKTNKFNARNEPCQYRIFSQLHMLS